MPQYPRTQSNVTAQVESMIAGFTNYPQDFPHADVPALQDAYNEFMQASAEFMSAQSQAMQAADRKLEKFGKLSAVMKRQIKQAQTDCTDKPVRLSEICWGPKAQPQPLDAPSQPTSLKIIAQEGNTVFLSWGKSSTRRGGPVRTYIIERWQQNGNSYPKWEIAATSYNPEAKLTNQPQGVKLNYQVKASNSSGESMATNVATVVL